MKNNKRNQIRILYDAFHRVGRKAFNHLDASGSYVFGEKYNVFHWLGAIPIFLLFMLLFTGLYMFIYYSMSIESTYESVKYITETAPGGLFIRSLHRYAADGVMFFLILHLFRVFFEEKYQNARWLAWVIGVFLLFLMLVEGVTGYMMAMDSKAQYVMEKTAEMLSGLKVFGDSLARSFAMQSLMSKWIMWVILVVHFAIPLLLLIFIYIHVKRVSRAKILPPRAVMIAVAGVFAGISLVFPVKMTPGADYSMIPHLTEMDWFYLFAKPFMEGGNWALNIWIAVLVVTVILYALPWLRKMPDIDVSEVDLDNCTGCGACALDCPYEAIRMVSRTDNSDKYKSHALTDPKLCMGCSVCVGSCNFEAMHLTRLRLPVIQDEIENALPMGKSGDKWVVIMCQRQSDSFDRSKMSLSEEIDSVVTLSYPCVGIVGPRLVEKVLDRGVRGVIIASCPEGDCDYREGNVWLTKRFLGQRRPQFKKLDETRPMAVFRYNPGEK
ncbi:MAG: cytochrome b N-terminal domain-containing protein, partial [Spirochaetota bacterium]|nr:cytochrome b N-terminal domain-containing protein [Spirochaetota bacterium]